MKKLLLTIYAIITIFIIAMIGATSTSAETEGDYTYTVSNGEVTITNFNTSVSGDITIPSTLGGYPVTSIGASAFRWCNLKSIVLPPSVTSIGSYAFENSDIESIVIGEGVTEIGYRAFSLCLNLVNIYIDSSAIADECLNAKSDSFDSRESELMIYVNKNIYVTLQYNRCPSDTQGEYTLYSFNHSYSFSCDSVCDKCEAFRHVDHKFEETWSSNATHHWHACSVCRKYNEDTHDEEIEHQFGNNLDENCDICGYTRQVQNESNNKGSNSLDNTTVIIIVIGTAVLGVGGGVLIGIRKRSK